MASMEEMSLDEEVQSVLFNKHSSKDTVISSQLEQASSMVSKKSNSKKKPLKKQSAPKDKAKEDKALNMSSLGHDQAKSAFIPYQPTTVLTNLQRGNMETEATTSSPELNLFQLVAQGEVFTCDIGDQVNKKDDNGMTLLMWASAYGQISTVKMLLIKLADVNIKGNEHGETALQLASAHGHGDIVKHLLSAGAEVDHVDDTGTSALMYAAYKNHATCVNHLLNAGADITLENELWQTALSLAVSRNSYQAIKIIEKHILKIMGK